MTLRFRVKHANLLQLRALVFFFSSSLRFLLNLSLSQLKNTLLRTRYKIPNVTCFFLYLSYYSCFDSQHKADKGEIRKQKALSKEYEDMLQEYKNQVDREQ